MQRERTDWLCQLLISKVSNGGYREASKSLERVDFISKSVVAPQWGLSISAVPTFILGIRSPWSDETL